MKSDASCTHGKYEYPGDEDPPIKYLVANASTSDNGKPGVHRNREDENAGCQIAG